MSFLLTGNRRTRNRSRGQSRPTDVKENTIRFEGDFDFESANAQFNREELDKEFKKKLNFKGLSLCVKVPPRSTHRVGQMVTAGVGGGPVGGLHPLRVTETCPVRWMARPWWSRPVVVVVGECWGWTSGGGAT